MTMTIAKRPRSTIHVTVLCVMMLPVWPFALHAQELSYDGKRWFEVEISVFTNEYPESQYAEQAVAGNLSLQFLPKLQKLLTPISSLMVEFPEPELPAVFAQAEPGNLEPQALEQQLESPTAIGPVYSPALRDSFKVNDYARDAFIALAGWAARFSSINRNLVDSSEHRILWHQVWRQPIQPRAQTPAIFVYGGEFRETHAELEGSLRLSDLGGQPTLDINLWLNSFADRPQTVESEWNVPELPLPLDEMEASPPGSSPQMTLLQAPTVTEVWQMQQTRDLRAEQLYYLDHPAFGVIIQIRPYLLPEQPLMTDEGDF
jgi:hypothetical protein